MAAVTYRYTVASTRQTIVFCYALPDQTAPLAEELCCQLLGGNFRVVTCLSIYLPAIPS